MQLLPSIRSLFMILIFTVGGCSNEQFLPSPNGAIADDASSPHVDLVWIGGPSVLIHFNGVTLLTDPTLGEDDFEMGNPNEMFDMAKGPNIIHHKRLVPLPDLDLESVDAVILSHAHEDHFDQGAIRKLDPDISMLAPPFDEEKLQGYGFSAVHSLDWGESYSISAGSGRIEIEVVPADHSRIEEINEFLGRGNGYRIHFIQDEWSRTIYWTGDSFPTEGVLAAAKTGDAPDVLMAHMGAVGFTGTLGQLSMGAEDVAAFEGSLKPKLVLPIHHSTYDLYLKPVSELETVRDRFGAELIYPEPGVPVTLD